VARRGPGRLKPFELRKLAKVEGRHADGGCLYLQVTRNKQTGRLRSSWVFDYGRAMGGGPLYDVPLAAARQWAHKQRLLRRQGIDPIEHRDAQRRAAAAASVKPPTFDEVRDKYLHEHAPKWRSADSGREWLSSLRRYATPYIGTMPVADVTLTDVIRTLEPIWNAKTQTAGRVRSRIEAVLAYAAVSGLRSGDNPARWKGLLDKKFATKTQLQPVVHLPALPFTKVADFVRQLRPQDSSVARAVEFAILCAARRGEVLGAKWDEIDGDVWTVPASRMKGGREHRVPLSAAALGVLERQRAIQRNEFVFPGAVSAHVKPVMVGKLLKRLGFTATLHGTARSSFRDWAGETTSFDSEVCEACLAHRIPDAARAAYERGTKFDKRRVMMQAWSDYVDGKVVEPTRLRAVS
jgi:integrase